MVTNPLPTVNITSPADGAAFAPGAPIEIKADANDADGLQYVSFWAGDRRLGTDTTMPYSFTVDHLEPGTYTLTAHAIDKFGQRGVSGPVKITVNKP
jgi:predicted phage tail protein